MSSLVYCAGVAIVTLLVRPYTVDISNYGDGYVGQCSCGWADVMVYAKHAEAKFNLRQHMLTRHWDSNIELVTRIER